MNSARIYAISVSPERGQLKKEVAEANIIQGQGIEGDGHAGDWGRQVTCLSWESVQNASKQYDLSAGPGDFAENILLEGLDVAGLKVGSRICLGDDVVLEITQIGKEDHPSVVTRSFGISLLPKEGLFCKVVVGGKIKKGDRVKLG